MSVLSAGARAARAVRAVVASPPYFTPGHFHSPLTSDEDVARARAWEQAAPGVDMREAAQLALSSDLTDVMSQPLPGPRWTAANPLFGPADAAAYRAMLNYLRPKRIIEVGSGYSTAVALDEGYAVTCIEPYPERLLALMRDGDPVTLLRQPVQDVAMSLYERLDVRDILFIDSSHVAKAGSDVCWLLLHVLPRLVPGVVVHVHDVFWPFSYPRQWLAEHRDWTEAYLLHAFLCGNASWKILLFTSWLWCCHPEVVPAHLRGQGPGSIWLQAR